MIDLEKPAVVSHDKNHPTVLPVSLFDMAETHGTERALQVGAALLTGIEEIDGFRIHDRDELVFQLRIISDPNYATETILWRRFAASETLNLSDFLYGSPIGFSDPEYLENFFAPEMVEHGKTSNEDASDVDSYHDYVVEDMDAFKAQLALFGIDGDPPAAGADVTLGAFARSYLSTIEAPWEVDESSDEYQEWLESAAEQMAAHLAQAVEAFGSSELDPPPEKE